MSEQTSSSAPSQTILFVEDEAIVRLAMADYLRDCGYKVLEVNDADEAVAVLKSDAHIDLVFTDVQMPGTMNGFELARWIRTNRPGMPVILTSGIDRLADRAADLCDEGPFLRKPYDRQQLLSRIRRALEKARRQGNVPPDDIQLAG